MDSQPQGIKLEDIYFVLFRRKWLILTMALIGLAAAAGVYFVVQPLYVSEAKLVVWYVMDSGAPLPPGGDERTRTPLGRAETIIDTELEILKSWDLVRKVVGLVGVEKILGHSGPADEILAAKTVLKGLTAEAPRQGNVIAVAYRHTDPETAYTVLTSLVAQYLERHVEVHRSTGTYDVLSRQTDQLRLRLSQTEEALRMLKNQAGVISVEDTKQSIVKQLETIHMALFDAEAELAQAQAFAGQNPSNSLAAVGVADPGGAELSGNRWSDRLASSPQITYQSLLTRLQLLRAKESDYASRFTTDSPMLRSLQEQIAEVETARTRLEAEHPELLALAVRAGPNSASGPAALMPLSERGQVAALQAKISVLTNQLAKVHAEAFALETNGNAIAQKQREVDLQDKVYRFFANSLEQTRISESLNSGRVPNISVAQSPSPPLRSRRELRRLLLGILGGCCGGGLALAFLLELYLDPRLKRASEIEMKLKLPFCLAIPWHPADADRASVGRPLLPAGKGPLEPWDAQHALRSHFAALGDRLVLAFERMNLTRKPKLVGVAGTQVGTGATTVAAGLAGTLSETGGGKVLLVDLTGREGAAHHFSQGKPACSLFDVLQEQVNGSAVVHPGVQLASVGDFSGEFHPARTKAFDALMPKLKASDYDYVIFDLPPLQSTSITFRLAGYLDQLLLVAEAEKSHRNALKQVVSELHQSSPNAKVAVVLNKARQYLPAWLDT